MSFSKFKKLSVSENPSQSIFINKSKGHIHGVLKVFQIQDGEFIVVYCPSLNITGYGKTVDEAESMFKDSINDYFESLMVLKKEAIDSELSLLGWDHGYFAKRYENKAFIDKQGVLKNFELPKDTPIKEKLIEVA